MMNRIGMILNCNTSTTIDTEYFNGTTVFYFSLYGYSSKRWCGYDDKSFSITSLKDCIKLYDTIYEQQGIKSIPGIVQKLNEYKLEINR